MSTTIRNAPSGENTSPQDSDAFPVTGSQYMQLSTVYPYVLGYAADSDITFTDITTGNADSDTHGFLPKLPGDSDQYIDGAGAWGVPPFISSVSDSDVIFTDNTTNNSDSDAHGYLPKLSGASGEYLSGDGTWRSTPSIGAVYDSDVIMQDITTNDADSDNHGFLPKLSGDSDQYLDGAGAWTTPPGGSGGLTASYTSLSPTTGNVTATVTDDINEHVADVSGLTANRNFVIPSGTQGQRGRLKIKTGDDTYSLIIIGDTGISIDGGTVATEWSRLRISGESIEWLYDDTNSVVIVQDGRVSCKCVLELSGNDTTHASGTPILPTWDTAPINIGNMADLVNYRVNIWRAGNYRVSGNWEPVNNSTDQMGWNTYVYLNGTGGTRVNTSNDRASGANGQAAVSLSAKLVTCAVGDYLDMYYQTGSANIGAKATEKTFFCVEEAW